MSDPPTATRSERPRPRLSNALSDELRQSVHNLETRRTSLERPRLSNAFTDELRQSVHKLETVRRTSTARPRLSNAFTDELRQSVHNLEAKKTNKYTAYARPKLPGSFTDELKQSVHNREKKVKRNLFGRPKLSEAFTDELRLSVHNLQEKSTTKKKGLFGGLFGGRKKEAPQQDIGLLPSKPTMTPVMEQTPSSSRRRRPLLDIDQVQPLDLTSDQSPTQTPEATKRSVVVKSPARSPKTSSRSQKNSSGNSRKIEEDSSIDESYMDHGRSKRSNNSRGSSNQSNFRPSLGRETRNDATKINAAKKPSETVKDRRVASFLREKESSLPDKSFHDDTSQFQNLGAFNSTSASPSVNDVFSRTVRSTHSRSIMDEQSHALDELDKDDSDLLNQTEGDLEAFRKEWMRLIKEKKQWKNKLATSRARNALMTQQVDDMTAENASLKSKLKRMEEKNAKLLEQQRADRIKLDKSADLSVRTRVEQTKATNENSKLKSKIFELESGLVTKDRLVEDLNDTIERQADIIDTLSNKLKDTETTKRLMEDEKRKLEDEIAVLIAKSDGDEMRDTFRQLEEEREKFFWQREMDMESKRLELEKLNDHHLKQEKVRHDKEMERHAEDEKRRRQLEEDRGTIEELMSEQLEELKEGNRRLRDQFERDRSDMAGEMKEKEREIAMLEREILEVQKQLSVRDQSAKEVELQKAQAMSAKDDLRDMRRHNVLLEKEIAKLKKKRKGKNDGQDWREIIFPGYRGVSFGTEDSEALAGFLTILVEEQGKKSRKGKRSTVDLSKALDEYKKSSKRPKREKEKTKKSKSQRRGRSRSREKKGHKKKKKSKEKKKVAKSKKTHQSKEKRKKHKSGKHKEHRKHKKRSSKKHQKSEHSRHVYLDNSMTLDENLDLMWRQSNYDRKGGNIVDDMSMLVFKQKHRQNKKKRSASATPSRRRQSSSHNQHRRRSRSNPPPEILLQ